jgi:G6PDH family F420-dependent oxidoreductase
MTSFGYTLSSEEHPPSELVRQAARAEEVGFDFLSISDHYHPWVSEQGHSPFVWSVLGAVAHATERIPAMVGVTCPIMRVHPAILAQATATTSLLFEGRFSFGVGTGEALNEHVVGRRWPPPDVRLAMLEEAIGIIRDLWSGETVEHRGEYFEVDNARLFDPPRSAPPVLVSAFGPKAIELAARLADGYIGTAPEKKVVDDYRSKGGKGPAYGQLTVCWAKSKEEARQTVKRVWPNRAVQGQLSQDLPTWTHFEQATSDLTEEQVVGSIPCGPDLDAFTLAVAEYLAAGYDHIYLHQIGPDQEGFFDFWSKQLHPALATIDKAA